jgi:hypothetical protein
MAEEEFEEGAVSVMRVPSWMKWPPNCCESCTGWIKKSDFEGVCGRVESMHSGDITESRRRCSEFKRRSDI